MHENYDLDQLLQMVRDKQFRALREILMEMKQMELKEQVDGHMKTLKQIMETYGID